MLLCTVVIRFCIVAYFAKADITKYARIEKKIAMQKYIRITEEKKQRPMYTLHKRKTN